MTRLCIRLMRHSRKNELTKIPSITATMVGRKENGVGLLDSPEGYNVGS